MEQGTKNKGRTPSPQRGTPPTLGGELPKKLYLDDGTEVRLVPIERTGRPLYVTKDGRGYSFTRGHLRAIKCNKRIPSSRKNRIDYYLCFRNYNDIYAHHAVLLAWGFPRSEGYECDHKNGNPFDNRLENLEWVTREENARRRWELKASMGLSFCGKKLSELSRSGLYDRRSGRKRKKGKLIQLTINFED